MSIYKYSESEGSSVVSKDGVDLKLQSPDSVPIDYDVYKDIKNKPETFKDKYQIKEKIVKGKLTKVVEAKDVSEDSKQPK